MKTITVEQKKVLTETVTLPLPCYRKQLFENSARTMFLFKIVHSDIIYQLEYSKGLHFLTMSGRSVQTTIGVSVEADEEEWNEWLMKAKADITTIY